MASPDLSFRLDQTRATVPTAEADQGLEYIGHTGSTLTLISGLPVANALNYGGFGNDIFVNNAISAAGGGLVPQTLGTAVYQNIHLVAGTRLVINSTFVPGDKAHNDESFALLKNLATGDIAPAHIANVNDVIANNDQNYATTFTIGATGDYNLLVGVADIGDKLHPSSLTITAMTVVVPAGQYTVLQSGVQLADSSLLRSDGALQIGGVLQSGYLANSGAGVVAALQTQLANKLISQDGGGLISQDGGGLISQDGGGIVSHDSGGLISQDGGGIVSHDSGGLISQDGGGFTGAQLAQIAASLAASNAAQFRAYAAASSSGLTSHNYGAMSLDGAGNPVPGTGGGTPSTVPVPGAEVNATPGAASDRYDGSSAVADLGGGRYAVAFVESQAQPSGNPTSAIRVQAINADGTNSGPELTASPSLSASTVYGTPANQLDKPSLAALGGGSLVVAWTNGNNIRPATTGFSTGSDVFAQVLNADGSKRGAVISLDAQTTNAQYTDVKVAALSGGGFVAVWGQTASPTNSLSSIHGKLFNADGTQRGSEFSVSGSTILADLRQPGVTATSDGGFAISFQGVTTNPATSSTITGIGAQTYTADGAAKARNPAIVAISDSHLLQGSSLSALPNGDIAVAWIDTPSPGASASAYSLVLTSALAPKSNATLVADSTVYYGTTTLAALSDGRFVVGYGPIDGAQGQIMSAANTAVGSPFNLYAPGGGDSETDPALLQLSTGTLIATTTHYFGSIGASDVRALPLTLGGSTASGQTAAGRALASGSAVHGYISGGTIFADANGNGVQDQGEASATTTADGAFALSPGATGALVLTGGIDLATGKPFTGRYTAPAGSHAIDALTTLIQGVIVRGADIGTAQMKVATALGMTADAELTNLDPMTAASLSAQTGQAVLLANALIADVADLATAAGSPDPLGAFAASIAAKNGFTAFDPTSQAALSAAGLSGQALTAAGAIAAAVKTLLTKRAGLAAGNGAILANDVNRLEVVVQQGATDLAAAVNTGTTAAVAAAYTGNALQTKFDAAAVFIAPSTVGVFRFFDSRYGTHFFTASTAERDTILQTRSDLVNEGVGLTAMDPASKDPNAAPVFRFFDTSYGTHFFTASATERDQVLANRPDLTFEGTGFYEHTAQQTGDTPVYRFFDKNFGTHFYTGDGGERATILSTRPDLVDEGIGFYAPKAAA